MEELDNYVGLHFKHRPSDIKKMMKLMQDTDIPEPTDHEDGASKTAVCIWEQEVTMHVCQAGRNLQEQQVCTLVLCRLGPVL